MELFTVKNVDLYYDKDDVAKDLPTTFCSLGKMQDNVTLTHK